MKRTPLKRKTPLKAGSKRLRAKKPGKPHRKTVIYSAAHRHWIEAQPCFLVGRICTTDRDRFVHICSGDVVAMHIRLGTDGGGSMKPSDRWTLPGCAVAHAAEHRGTRTFIRQYKLGNEDGRGLRGYCTAYAKASPFRSELGDL